ncbi:MAG: SGNH/GDSL hydrolase family protein [Sphingomonadaceae bacterium]
MLALAASPAQAQSWAAGWFSPPFAPTAVRPATTPPIFSNQTTRRIVRIETSGDAIRLRLTNELGITPVQVADVHVAKVDSKGRIVPGSDRQVTFDGRKEAWIPVRSPMLSDPVAMPVEALQHIAISVYYADATMPAAHHANLMVAPGNQTSSVTMVSSTQERGPGLTSEIDVERPESAPVIVTFGDSITEGARSTPDADMSWPQQLAQRIHKDPERRYWSVVNSGMSGNRLLHQGFGEPALARFDRDVLAIPGITHIVLLEGINDIGWWNKPESHVDADMVIGAYKQIVARAHAHGVKVIGATMLPYKGAVYYTPEGEQMRETVNKFIRTSGLFDGVIDFEKATRDPSDPQRIRPAFDPDDHLHENDTGYGAMADAVPLSLFK